MGLTLFHNLDRFFQGFRRICFEHTRELLCAKDFEQEVRVWRRANVESSNFDMLDGNDIRRQPFRLRFLPLRLGGRWFRDRL